MKIKVLKKRECHGSGWTEVYPGYFFTDDTDCRDYDWLVVFEDMPKDFPEVLVCPRERTMLLTWEPVSVKRYSKAFTRQFGHLLSNRPLEAERHPHYHLGRGYFPWFINRSISEAASFVMPPKTRTISTVCSSKQMKQTLHHARLELTKYLSQVIPDFEWYGHGIRDLKIKEDALDAFKYHVAVENHIAPYHWSEKIADSILCECLTFYAGDPCLDEVLPRDSFIPIPIDNPEAAAQIIRTAIESNEYEKRLPAIKAAKKLLLEKYNFYAQIVSLITELEDQQVTPVNPHKPVVLFSRKTLRKKNLLVALSDGFEHFLGYLKGQR